MFNRSFAVDELVLRVYLSVHGGPHWSYALLNPDRWNNVGIFLEAGADFVAGRAPARTRAGRWGGHIQKIGCLRQDLDSTACLVRGRSFFGHAADGVCLVPFSWCCSSFQEYGSD